MNLNGTITTNRGRELVFDFMTDELNKPVINCNGLFNSYQNINATLLINGYPVDFNNPNFKKMFFNARVDIINLELTENEIAEAGYFFKDVILNDYDNLDTMINEYYLKNERDINYISEKSIGIELMDMIIEFITAIDYDFPALILSAYEFCNGYQDFSQYNTIYESLRSYIISFLDEDLNLGLELY